MSIVAETEQIADRRNSCLESRARIFDGSVRRLIARWTKLPDRQAFSPQEAMGAFLLAHIALGRLGHELEFPMPLTIDTQQNAVRAAGHILYCLNRIDFRVLKRTDLSTFLNYDEARTRTAKIVGPLEGRAQNLVRAFEDAEKF